MENYSAKNIKVLTPKESGAMDFIRIAELADRYNKPKEYIERGFAACRLAGVDPESYFKRRYLDGDKSIPVNAIVDVISRDIQRDKRHN